MRAWDERVAPSGAGGLREEHGLQCGYCTPGFVMATVSLLHDSQSERGRDPARAGGQPAAAPATTTSSAPYRWRPAPWRSDDGDSYRDSGRPDRRHSVERKEDMASSPGGQVRDDMSVPGMVWMSVVRSLYAHARIRSVDVRARSHTGEPSPRSPARSHRRVAGVASVRVAPDRGYESSNHRPLAVDEARCRRRRCRDRGEPRGCARRSRTVSTTSRCRSSSIPSARSRRVRRSCTRSSARTAATPGHLGRAVDEEFDRADVIVKQRYRQQRPIPNAIEPRGVLVEPFPATGELTMWSATRFRTSRA